MTNKALRYYVMVCYFVMIPIFNSCKSTAIENTDYIILNNRPNAQIVVNVNANSSVRLAAKEFQDYIKKITGAILPIIYIPDENSKINAKKSKSSKEHPISVYIGESKETKELGINFTPSKWGGYSIVTGENWLAQVGNDTAFTPKGIYSTNRSQWYNNKIHEWETLTKDTEWINSLPSGYCISYRY